MRRRDFLKVTGGAAAAGGAGLGVVTGSAAAFPASRETPDTAPRRVRFRTPWPDVTNGPSDHIHRFAARFSKALGGRSDIEVESSVASGTTTGDLYAGRVADALRGEPAAAFFDGLPAFTGLDAEGMAAWMSAGGGRELLDELGARQGVKPLIIGHMGAPLSLWSREVLQVPEDFAGRRIAVSGLARDVVQGLGGIAVELPPAEIATALADRAIDIAEAPDASIATRVALAATGAHGYVSPFSVDGAALALTISDRLWWSLADSDRLVIEALAAAAFSSHRHEAMAETAMAQCLQPQLPRLRLTGAKITDTVASVTQSIVAQIASRDDLSQRINRSYMAFRRHHLRRDVAVIG